MSTPLARSVLHILIGLLIAIVFYGSFKVLEDLLSQSSTGKCYQVTLYLPDKEPKVWYTEEFHNAGSNYWFTDLTGTKLEIAGTIVVERLKGKPNTKSINPQPPYSYLPGESK